MLDGKHNIYIHKGVTVRFGFDGRRTSQTHRQVKNKATGTSHGVYYILYALIGLLCVFHSEARGVTIYSHLRGAFSVVHSKTTILICYLLDYQQVRENTNVSIILLGDKKEPTK